MKIKISNLRDGEYFYSFKVDTKELNLEDTEIKDNIDVDVKLVKTLGSIFTNIKAKGTMIFTCDRCLDKFDYLFEADFEILYKVSNTDFVTNNIKEDVNVYDLKPETAEIDITEPVRDYVILSVPMRKVPEEKDGKCVMCGRVIEEMFKPEAGKEINPVWDKLLGNKK